MARPKPTRYQFVGSYLGQIYQPSTLSPGESVFRPCVVGKGARLATSTNVPKIRSWIEGADLTFSTVPPYIATLPYAAKPDSAPPVSLYDGDGNEVPTSKWSFWESTPGSGTYDQVLFNPADYDRLKSYTIDYQASVRTPLDTIDIDALRRIIRVGKYPDQTYYQESLAPATDGKDFLVPGSLDTFTVGTANVNKLPTTSAITTTLQPASTGSVVFGASNAYSRTQTRYYRITCTGIGAGPPKSATFKIEVWNHSGLNAAQPQVPLVSGMADKTFTIESGGTGNTLDINRPLIDGIYLTFAVGGSNFVMGDKFEFWGYGGTLIEPHSAFDSLNSQFSTISTPATAGNTNWAAAPPTTAANTSTMNPTVTAGAEYTGAYVRHYKLECTAAGGTYATGSLTFVLADIVDNDYFTISNGLAAVTFEFEKTGGFVPVPGRIAIDITLAASDNDVAVAARAAINNVANWPGGNNYVVAAVPVLGATALAQTKYGTAANVAIVAVAVTATGIVATGMSGGTRTGTLRWAGMDELPYSTGSKNLDEAVSTTYTDVAIENGIALSWVWPAFPDQLALVVGDSWLFVARPGREYYNAKDDRVYTLTAGTPTSQNLPLTYAATTTEGGFGVQTATCLASGAGGLITLADNVRFLVRNIGNALDTPTGANAPNRWTASDTYTFAATCDDVINWNIDVRVSETLASTAILFDAVGNATGVAGVYYVILDTTPTSVLSVKNLAGVNIAYTWITGTPYVTFTADPATTVVVRYQHAGREPAPGDGYYITGSRLRAATEYDTPLLWRSEDQMAAALKPMGTTNDVLIGGQILKAAAGSKLDAWYTCQVQDLDDDGAYQLSDYRRAIDATTAVAPISDLIVLNKFSAMADAIRNLNDANDMFNFPSKVRMLWQGMSVGAPLGDENTEGSKIYTARRSLQVSGDDPSHGCHVLIGNSWADREIVLDDGTTTTVTLDGSFIATAACGLQRGLSDIANTILKKKLSGIFTDMEDMSVPDQKACGAASITFLRIEGESIQTFYEDVSVDTSAIDYQQINAMAQKHNYIRRATVTLADKLTGWVPPDAYAAVMMIKGFIAEITEGAIAVGWIAPYGSEQVPPTRRQINPKTDIDVLQDPVEKTWFYYRTWFNLRYPIKRTSGLFGVDSNAIMKGTF
jgi:hypothetical protein